MQSDMYMDTLYIQQKLDQRRNNDAVVRMSAMKLQP